MSPYLLMRDYKQQVGQGMIVNILDERITKNIPTFAAYSVSKVALEHVTKLAAVEWGETVRVNAIAPGLILPPAGHGQEYLDKNKKNVPTQTHGDVADLTRALDYLIASPFINGEILFVDGGASKSGSSQQPHQTQSVTLDPTGPWRPSGVTLDLLKGKFFKEEV